MTQTAVAERGSEQARHRDAKLAGGTGDDRFDLVRP
jgi:hypothetical protein